MKNPHLLTTILSENDPVIFSLTTKHSTPEEAMDQARKALPLLNKPYLITIRNLITQEELFKKKL